MAALLFTLAESGSIGVPKGHGDKDCNATVMSAPCE
jgi:hypothetical protein